MALDLLHERLSRDQSGVYSTMDHDSKACYARRVLAISDVTGVSAIDVANAAVELSKAAHAEQHVDCNAQCHVGFYLFRSGLKNLFKTLGVRMPFREWLALTVRHSPSSFYFLLLTVVCTLFAASFIYMCDRWRLFPLTLWNDGLLLSLCAVAFFETSVSFVDTIVQNAFSYAAPFRIDFSEGIPARAMTLLVIPVILTKNNFDELLKKIEGHYLLDREPNIRYCILSDFSDSATQARDDENRMVQLLVERVEALNSKHVCSGAQRFLVMHRSRTWNALEQTWMGWERKRGKLEELNRTILGQPTKSRFIFSHDASWLRSIKYVFTLDFDTGIERGVIKSLVQIIEHPFNAPVIDPIHRSVVSGYTFLQPRLCFLNGDEPTSLYGLNALLRSSHRTPDVRGNVNNLIGEGVFMGKGLYSVEAFFLSNLGLLQENLILSHDLIEGALGKTSYVQDVSLIEPPSKNFLDSSRTWHRWMRGDWQTMLWYVMSHHCLFYQLDKRKRCRLTSFSRWRIFENVRRNLSSVATLLLLVAGWCIASDPWAWSACFIGSAIFAVTFDFAFSVLAMKERGDRRKTAARLQIQIFLADMVQVLLYLATLPISALISLDAIFRSTFRVYFTRKRILEWTPSSNLANARTLSMTVAIGGSSVLLLTLAANYRSLSQVSFILPFLLLWCLSPILISLSGIALFRRPRARGMPDDRRQSADY
ncbi:hypothetical protein [Dyella sp. GSA-30]|uniref:hypothetical protein n=1 Tax=Dyella sp. GSA-30 TaxID=2994496 RepID=UPI002490EDE5|nr:hypothetical protein [Dyella sp. GSA-30]